MILRLYTHLEYFQLHIFSIAYLREGLYQIYAYQWVYNLYKLNIVKNNVYNALVVIFVYWYLTCTYIDYIRSFFSCNLLTIITYINGI